MNRPLDLITMFDFGDRPDTSKKVQHTDDRDTPTDLEVSSAIRFVQGDLPNLSDGEDMVR